MQGPYLAQPFDICKSLLSVQQHLTSHTNKWYWLQKGKGDMSLPKPSIVLSTFYLLLYENKSILRVAFRYFHFFSISLTPQLQLQFFTTACLFPYTWISNGFHSPNHPPFCLSPALPSLAPNTKSTRWVLLVLPNGAQPHLQPCSLIPRLLHITSLGSRPSRRTINRCK